MVETTAMETPRLDAQTRADAQRWLRERTQRTTIVGIAGALLTFPTVLIPAYILLLVMVHRRHATGLLERGVFLPAELIGLRPGLDSAPDTAGAYFADSRDDIPDAGDADLMTPIHGAVAVLRPLVSTLSAWLPLAIVRYRFELEGRARETGRYMYGDECFFSDGAGRRWAYVDPRHPRLNTWLVSKRRQHP